MLTVCIANSPHTWLTHRAGSCYEAYNTRLNAIIEQYHDIIAGLFFGHSHTDGYMVFKDAATQSTPLAVGLIPGSVTTYGGLNPTFRVYQYDRYRFDHSACCFEFMAADMTALHTDKHSKSSIGRSTRAI